jgi:hypothetical protein
VNIECVICDHCSKMFEKDSKEFYTVRGSITLGNNEDIVGEFTQGSIGGIYIETVYICKECMIGLLKLNDLTVGIR